MAEKPKPKSKKHVYKEAKPTINFADDVGPSKVKDEEEVFYRIRKITLAEYQIVEIKVKNGRETKRIDHEPDMAGIVISKLTRIIARSENV